MARQENQCSIIIRYSQTSLTTLLKHHLALATRALGRPQGALDNIRCVVAGRLCGYNDDVDRSRWRCGVNLYTTASRCDLCLPCGALLILILPLLLYGTNQRLLIAVANSRHATVAADAVCLNAAAKQKQDGYERYNAVHYSFSA